MTIEQAKATPSPLRFRAPESRTWMLLLVIGMGGLALAAVNLTGLRPVRPSLAFVVLGCCYVPMVWAIRSFGVDLTRESAVVRGFRQRHIPWPEVQAVVPHAPANRASSVSLILANGESMRLPYPRTLCRPGDEHYERDVERIEEWWRAHRGPSWRSNSLVEGQGDIGEQARAEGQQP
jgi:hypothetical protein